MIRIAICDDDILFAGNLETMVQKEAVKQGMNVETEVFSDGIDLKKSFNDVYDKFDLIYLDIEMKRMNGIEIARQIRRFDKSVLIIYISSHDQYLKELFEVEPFRFLSKPLDIGKFSQYFEDACIRFRENEQGFQFMFNKEFKKIQIKNIVYFESRNRVVHIFLKNGEEERFYGKLNEVEKEMEIKNKNFLRIHQSYLVNYDYVYSMNFASLVVEKNDESKIELQISEDRQKKVRRKLMEIAKKEAKIG